MASVVKRVKRGRAYYYLYHDSRSGGRRQREEYLGASIPPDIEERKMAFEYESFMEHWRPRLEAIRGAHAKKESRIPKPAREKALAEFAVRFTYNTQKIEGSALTLMDTSLLLADRITPSNRPAGDVREAEAHQKIFLEMVSGKKDLTSTAVKSWNRRLLADTKPNIAGALRGHDVRISGSRFVPPPRAAVGALFREFFRWYRSNKNTNPAELAALAHLKLATIHPFSDGNGRISRLAMNCVLNLHGYPMLDIGYRDRRPYYAALEKSQTSDDPAPFVKWFVRLYVRTHGCLPDKRRGAPARAPPGKRKSGKRPDAGDRSV